MLKFPYSNSFFERSINKEWYDFIYTTLGITRRTTLCGFNMFFLVIKGLGSFSTIDLLSRVNINVILIFFYRC